MTARTALKVVLWVSLAGTAFSGTLVWRELIHRTAGCTPLGSSGTILGYPPCVYGLVMYLALVAVAALGLRSGR